LENYMNFDRDRDWEVELRKWDRPTPVKIGDLQDKFLRGYLEDLDEDHTKDNSPGHEDWRDADEIDED